MRERLTLAYHTATTAAHGLGRVEIHVGPDVLQWMKDECSVPDPSIQRTTVWGFPVVPVGEPADHLSVHVVTVIP